MKTTPMRSVLLAAGSVAVLLSSACPSASLAGSNPPAYVLVPVVLQANPDILGGLVGREAISALGTPHPAAGTTQIQRAQLDQRAYGIWMQSQMS